GMIVVGRQQYNSVPEPNPPGALSAGGEEDLRGGRVRVFLEKVMLDFPHMVDAEPVGELDLVEGVLKQFQFSVRLPRSWQLMLIEGTEFHGGKMVLLGIC